MNANAMLGQYLTNIKNILNVIYLNEHKLTVTILDLGGG